MAAIAQKAAAPHHMEQEREPGRHASRITMVGERRTDIVRNAQNQPGWKNGDQAAAKTDAQSHDSA